ncbi:hypothetical protein A9K68_028805 [Mesorhizobium sp. AA22]|nr:hypothetical protein A9K68_028805 [Mesorhizobium sp. AA22]
MNCPPFRPATRHKQESLEDILEERLISEGYQRIELIRGTRRQRYWATQQKLLIIAKVLKP